MIEATVFCLLTLLSLKMHGSVQCDDMILNGILFCPIVSTYFQYLHSLFGLYCRLFNAE